MREITCSTITDAIKKMCIEAATILPQDVEKALSQKHDEEDSALAQKTLQVLMDNAKLAQEKQMPICQDTGMAFVYVTMGQEVHITGGSLNEAIQEGVRQGYTEGYLRKSVVKDPLFERTNTKDNTPAIIYYDIVEGDTFHITLAPKGFGSENMSQIKMLKPSDGLQGIKDFVMKVVNDAGPNACPPMVIGVGIGVLAQPQLIVRFMTVKSDKELNRSVLVGGLFIAIMPTTAYIVGSLSNVYFFDKLGKIAVDVVGGNVDKVIPTFITMALPEWFVYIFLLSLLAAAMSTISSQLHTQGTAFGVDIYGTLRNKAKQKADQITVTRIGILIAIILALILAFSLPGSIIALGTSLFFEICAAAFLPVFLGALYWKGITTKGAIAGIVSGTVVSLFWLLFVFAKTAKGLGLCKAIFGCATLLPAMPWPYIDVMLIAVPISAIFTLVVSLLTKPPAQEIIDKAFEDIDNKGSGVQ